MKIGEIRKLVASTADASFAIDMSGLIVAWNRGAEELMGFPAVEVLGKPCGQVIQGADECGMVCSRDCTVRQAARAGHPMRNFDLQIQTKEGSRWCNLSVLMAGDPQSIAVYSIHIIRLIDTRKRLEMLVRDFVVSSAHVPADQAAALISTTRAPARETDLTRRELEVLKLLSKGSTTAAIASRLHVSRTTVNNHVQHILRKLDVHTRLEAIRRAELAGII